MLLFFACRPFIQHPLQDVLVIYGDWLFDRREYSQAATGMYNALSSRVFLLTVTPFMYSIRRSKSTIKSTGIV